MISKEDLELILLVLGLMHIDEKREDFLNEDQIKRVNDFQNILNELRGKDEFRQYNNDIINLVKEIFKDK